MLCNTCGKRIKSDTMEAHIIPMWVIPVLEALGIHGPLYTHDGACTKATAERCNEIEKERDALLEALKEISKGQGAFSMDHLTHAVNTIEDMKGIAKVAIAKAEGRQS